MADQTFVELSKLATELGFTLTFEHNSGNVYRECNACGFIATFSGISNIDLTPCGCSDAPNQPISGDLAFTPGFIPIDTGRYVFNHRGVSVDLFLVGDKWLCSCSDIGLQDTIPADTTATDMRSQLITLIEDTAADYFLLKADRMALDWISAKPIPFSGELDADDAPDSIPGCYGL